MRMTTDEIKVVTFLVLAFTVGALVKHYRNQHPRPLMSTPLPAKASGYPSARPR